MKRLLPLLLALLLLTACGSASPEEENRAEETPAVPVEEFDEDELPILPAGAEVSDPAGEEDAPAPELSSTAVTLDGIGSYLRLTLPEGWTWEQGEGPKEIELILLRPSDDPDFVVEMRLWNDGFAMCGTGVTFQDYTLPDGRTAKLAYEIVDDTMTWTLILPESPDAFTIQFTAPKALYEAHRAELELMLGTICQGVRAEPDAAGPVGVTG